MAETCPYGIIKDVGTLFHIFMVITDAVVKEIALPMNAQFSCRERFPRADSLFESVFPLKRNHGMEVIRHENHETACPFFMIMIELGRAQKRHSQNGVAKLIQSLRISTNRDKKTGIPFDPLRNVMTQSAFLIHCLDEGQ
jgi:hypothetical protein